MTTDRQSKSKVKPAKDAGQSVLFPTTSDVDVPNLPKAVPQTTSLSDPTSKAAARQEEKDSNWADNDKAQPHAKNARSSLF